MGFSITFLDHTVETIADADAYDHDRQMTTFYRTANARGAIDCWSTPLLGIRTSEILMIRRLADEDSSDYPEVRELLAG